MATFQITSAAPEYEWWPDLMYEDFQNFPGTITTTSTLYGFSWDKGFGVISANFAGTGLTYSSGAFPDGARPVSGTVNTMTVSVGGVVWLTISGLKVDAADVDHFFTGFPRDGYYQDADPFNLFTFLMAGKDVIYGSANGDDLIAGRNPGNDTIYGLGGDDFIKADAGSDLVNGGKGRDTYALDETFFDSYATRGAVVNLTLGTATDSWGGTDTLVGIEDVRGSRFRDVIIGNKANNEIAGLKGRDTLDGGAGSFDKLRYDRDFEKGGQSGVMVNLATGIATDGWGAQDTIRNFEAVRGSRMDDAITGNESNNHFDGGDGADTLIGGGGSDTLIGNLGADTMTGGTGGDSFVFGGWSGNAFEGDTITDFATGVDNLFFDTGSIAGMDGALRFNYGSAATGSGSSFFFDSSNRLWWDADGTGGGSAVLVATLTSGTLSASDILLG